jgi:hypothetical protein
MVAKAERKERTTQSALKAAMMTTSRACQPRAGIGAAGGGGPGGVPIERGFLKPHKSVARRTELYQKSCDLAPLS